MISRVSSTIFLFFLASTMAFSQQSTRTISGLVTTEESAPLEGVAVNVKGTPKVSGSQADGIYYISLSDKDSVLVFSCQEYQTQEIKLNASNEYNVVLRKKKAGLTENGIAWIREYFTKTIQGEIHVNIGRESHKK